MNTEPKPIPKVQHAEIERMQTLHHPTRVIIPFDEDNNFAATEVYIIQGKQGSINAASNEALGRLCSLLLRSIPYELAFEILTKQLQGIASGETSWEDGVMLRSSPDAISRALNNFEKRRQLKLQELQDEHKFVSLIAGNPCLPNVGLSNANDEAICESAP